MKTTFCMDNLYLVIMLIIKFNPYWSFIALNIHWQTLRLVIFAVSNHIVLCLIAVGRQGSTNWATTHPNYNCINQINAWMLFKVNCDSNIGQCQTYLIHSFQTILLRKYNLSTAVFMINEILQAFVQNILLYSKYTLNVK